MSLDLWNCCIELLRDELPSQQFNTWIRPLQAELISGKIQVYAPNRFVLDWVSEKYLTRLNELVEKYSEKKPAPEIYLCVGSKKSLISQPDLSKKSSTEPLTEPKLRVCSNSDLDVFEKKVSKNKVVRQKNQKPSFVESEKPEQLSIPVESFAEDIKKSPLEEQQLITQEKTSDLNSSNLESYSSDSFEKERLIQTNWAKHATYLNKSFNFESFVEGKSNQLARAAAWQVAENPGNSYNPLFLYGGVGLGKTHLMHSVGNYLLRSNPQMKVVYLHSERFVADMVKALQLNAINDFKKFYRSVDALLIDDIQFFARKERSQEEFFHTFNSLLELGKQVILTSDRYPKEIDGLDDRLKSRFGWGLTVAVEPPELETRIIILMNKAAQAGINLSQEAAFFIAQRVRSNVRELEGALKRVIAHAHFMGCSITIDLVRESLKDLLALQEKLVSIDNIQRVVSEYYKLKLIDLLSKKRTRSIARPRQVAMALSKELTSHSLPEIGNAFGGRDHTTVLHACRQIIKLRETDPEIHEDYKNLLRILST